MTEHEKKTIVIAAFGATHPKALGAISGMAEKVRKSFPELEVRIAFTSNIIRKIWHKRRTDKEFIAAYGDMLREFFYVKGPLATIADLQDEGFRTIIVQPTHIYAGEEFFDLVSYINGLNSIKTVKPKYLPFRKLVVGRPLLGMPGPLYDYHKDMIAVAKALAPDVELVRKDNAALVYMGHGNKFYSTGVYSEFQEVMRGMYPETPVFVGTVEGFPGLDIVMDGLVHIGADRVVLVPFMMVAGDHARNDMAGDRADSWKSVMCSRGIRVACVLRGLGERPGIQAIFIQHIREVAEDHSISL